MKTLDDPEFAQLSGRTVLVRADLNVPRDKGSGAITDDGRIRASLPTLTTLLDRGARVVVFSHLGRPKGAYDEKLTLAPVAARMAELLGRPVSFAGVDKRIEVSLGGDHEGNDGSAEVAGAAAQAAVRGLGDGSIAMLDNLRFDARETSKDAAERGAFADELAALAGDGGLYVGDGFGAVHRKHASVYELPTKLTAVAGKLIVAEVDVLRRLTAEPARPYAVVLGGSKVSDKLGVIDNLLETADKLLIGGGMVFTFLKAQGAEIGKSLLEEDQLDTVRGYLDRAEKSGVEIVLPTDIVAATEFAADAPADVVGADSIPAERIGLDIGPESGKQFADALRDCETVFWNGPMGVFEMPRFAEGTRAVAQALTEVDGLTVIGGGDSASAVRSLGFADTDFGHISTGGGASLEYLEGKALPGLEALGV